MGLVAGISGWTTVPEVGWKPEDRAEEKGSVRGIRLSALSMEKGQTSRSPTMPQSSTRTHLGAGFSSSRNTTTASISGMA